MLSLLRTTVFFASVALFTGAACVGYFGGNQAFSYFFGVTFSGSIYSILDIQFWLGSALIAVSVISTSFGFLLVFVAPLGFIFPSIFKTPGWVNKGSRSHWLYKVGLWYAISLKADIESDINDPNK